jgi:CSLREA domain-containing protein
MKNPSNNPSPQSVDSTRRLLFLRMSAVIGLSMVLFLALIFPRGAQAATFVVDTTADDPTKTACTASPDDCSLRGAIIKANTTLGDDVITLPAGVYTLTVPGTDESASANGNLDINSNLTINGAGQASTIIDGNGAVTGENVLRISGGWTVALNDLTVQGGDWSSAGGILNFSNLTLTNVTVTGNQSTLQGGGMTTQNGTVDINSSTFSNNTAGQYGGGLSIVSGTVTITSSNFTGNVGTNAGGGINQDGGSLTIDGNSQIAQNSADVGGGIDAGAIVTIENSQVYMNQASSSGGGIYIGSSASVTLTDTTVSRNDGVGSGSGGGGIFIYGSLEMYGGQVALNTADYFGGGIYLNYLSTADIHDAYINDNHTTANPSYGGGGIYNSGGTVLLDGCTVTTNYLSGSGGTSNYGGGVFSWGGDLTITDSKITSNDALTSGGGVFFQDGNLMITNSVFRNNSASAALGSGGGLFNGSDTATVIQQSEFSGNDAGNDGGGIHTQGVISLENVTISGNTSDDGAGMLSTGGTGVTTDILNSTIYGNIVPSGSNAGGLVAYNAVGIKNTIIAGNDNDECLNSSGTAITSNGNNISGDATCGFSAGGDQPGTDPLLGLLADNGGFSKTHALLPGSPALDAGTNSGCPASDQRGVNRPIDGDTDGTATCDVGAYEGMINLFLPLITR